MPKLRTLIVSFAVLAAAGGGGWWWTQKQAEAAKPQLRTAKVERGTLTATVAASGTLAAVVQVQVSRASPCDQDTIAGMLKSAQGRIRRCVDGAPGSWSAKVQLTQSQPAAARQVHSTFEPRQQRCLMARVVRPLRATGAKQCLPQLKIVVD